MDGECAVADAPYCEEPFLNSLLETVQIPDLQRNWGWDEFETMILERFKKYALPAIKL
ncbi:MAG: hypothetical protein NZM28_00220 [Fimbriimonadales bacterium]|nr:hypothetical protein [Fimbriimonadales bacterium]